jgi:hypothetical protein
MSNTIEMSHSTYHFCLSNIDEQVHIIIII